MRGRRAPWVALLLALLSACGSTTAGQGFGPAPTSPASTPPSALPSAPPSSAPVSTPPPKPVLTPAGNPNGHAAIPAEARAEDTSHPTRVIGTGTPQSCTSQAVVAAVAAGGVVTFACGPNPVTIPRAATAKVRNNSGPKVVLDGGGLVTLSGGGARRILYLNTCDKAQGITTSHCQDQDSPQLTLQNLTFTDGNSTGDTTEGGGGGAVFVRGGRVKVVNSRFTHNRCDATGPDLGGAGLRVLSQSKGLPVYIVGSTFDGNTCSNGGALSSIQVSWVVLNSLITNNSAIGHGANPAKPGTPGGGSGGGIYNDGDNFTLRVAGTLMENNKANEGGGAIFFVSNDRTGTLTLDNSVLRHNPNTGFETAPYHGIFFLGSGNPRTTNTVIQ
jgi:hypothetical protein